MNRLSSSSSSFRQSPVAILLSPVGPAGAFSPQAVSSAMLPSMVRRTSAATTPDAGLVQDPMVRTPVGMAGVLSSPTDGGKVVYPLTVLDPSMQSASFATYYTGPLSAVSPTKLLGLSISLVASFVIFTYVEHDFKLSPIPLALSVSVLCALSLRFLIPARFLLSSSSSSASSMSSESGKMVGSHLHVSAVFSDKHRTYRAFALGILQTIYMTVFAFSATRQSMTSMHMNYFSVLPILDLVLQKFVLKIPSKLTRRTILGSVLNIAPQALALLAWDWVVGIEGIPVAVVQILWVYVIYLEQAATETAAWLASVYVGFLFSVATLIPLTIGSFVYESYHPSLSSEMADNNKQVSLALSIAVTMILGFALGVMFLTSGFLVKWSSSAHIVVLVSTASAILISASDAALPVWAKLTALGVMTIAWFVYVK
ncbi:hypothetical protein V1525DRAFT_414111 [Lipomyces kononenkoae]|uniref:Uncharacterized protein n=1 Tax=Lipomyces kononenkoae TaxID=34357 RepID=A0ACC3SSL9_LIPKO